MPRLAATYNCRPPCDVLQVPEGIHLAERPPATHLASRGASRDQVAQEQAPEPVPHGPQGGGVLLGPGDLVSPTEHQELLSG